MTIEQAVPIRSTIPARLDRLRWSPFHTRMVVGRKPMIAGCRPDAVFYATRFVAGTCAQPPRPLHGLSSERSADG